MSTPKAEDADYMKAFIKSCMLVNQQPVNFENFAQDFEDGNKYCEYYNDAVYYSYIYADDSDLNKGDYFDIPENNKVAYVLKHGENKRYFKHFLPLVDYVIENGLVDTEFTVEKL